MAAKRGTRRRKTLIVPLSWRQFREKMLQYADLDGDRRSDLLFRGQGDSSHPLIATLDRNVAFDDDAEREDFVERMNRELRDELIHLADDSQHVPEDMALELLARHHGLPSPLLDWTRSPWIAAYFAFSSADRNAQRVAVWRLDRARVPPTAPVEFVDDPDLLRFNRRALMQRAIFIRVNSVENELTDTLGPALIRYQMLLKESDLALADLDEMGINGTRLFADVSGACMTVWDRMRLPLKDDSDDAS